MNHLHFSPNWLLGFIYNKENRFVFFDSIPSDPVPQNPFEGPQEKKHPFAKQLEKKWEKKIEKLLTDKTEDRSVLKDFIKESILDDAKIDANEHAIMEDIILASLRENGADIPNNIFLVEIVYIAIDAGIFTMDDFLKAKIKGKKIETGDMSLSEDAKEILRLYEESKRNYERVSYKRGKWMRSKNEEGVLRRYKEEFPQEIKDAIVSAQDDMREYRKDFEDETGMSISKYKGKRNAKDRETSFAEINARMEAKGWGENVKNSPKKKNRNQSAMEAAERMANSSRVGHLGYDYYAYRALAKQKLRNQREPRVNWSNAMADSYQPGAEIRDGVFDSTREHNYDRGIAEHLDGVYGETNPEQYAETGPTDQEMIEDWLAGRLETFPHQAGYYPDEASGMEAENLRRADQYYERMHQQFSQKVIEKLGPTGELRQQIEDNEITDPEHLRMAKELCDIYERNSAKWRMGQETRNETRIITFLHQALEGLQRVRAEKKEGVQTKEQKVEALFLGPDLEPRSELNGNSFKQTYEFTKNASALIIDINGNTHGLNSIDPNTSSERTIIELRNEHGILLQPIPDTNGGSHRWNIHFYKVGNYKINYKDGNDRSVDGENITIDATAENVSEKQGTIFDKIPGITKVADKYILESNGKSIAIFSYNAPHLFFDECNDEGLEHITKSTQLDSLELINLENCTDITNKGLLQLQKIKSLKYLYLSGCNRITDDGLEHLQNLKQLEELSLGDCVNITDQGLSIISDNNTSLVYLNIKRSNVSATGLKHLKKLTDLKILDLTDCKGIGTIPAILFPSRDEIEGIW